MLKFFLKQVLYLVGHNPNLNRKQVSELDGAPSYSTICKAVKRHKELGYIIEKDGKLKVADWLGISPYDPTMIVVSKEKTTQDKHRKRDP